MKKPKVVVWKNGCGATVGRSIIHFTNIRNTKNQEGVYVTLKYPIWHCLNILYINNHHPSNLRRVIKQAKFLQDPLSYK